MAAPGTRPAQTGQTTRLAKADYSRVSLLAVTSPVHLSLL